MHTLETLATVDDELVDYLVKPNFRALGRPVRQGHADGRQGDRGCGRGGAGRRAAYGRDGQRHRGRASPCRSVPDEVIVTQTPKAGWTVASDGGETVALETTLTPELRREGLAREVIRLIQDARKSDGLDVTDRITLWWEASDPELAAALTEQAAVIAAEVLATSFEPGEPSPETADAGFAEHRDDLLGLRFWLRRA